MLSNCVTKSVTNMIPLLCHIGHSTERFASFVFIFASPSLLLPHHGPSVAVVPKGGVEKGVEGGGCRAKKIHAHARGLICPHSANNCDWAQ